MTLPPFYPILDPALLESRGGALQTAAEAMIGAGVGILQIRVKGPWTGALLDQAGRIAQSCRESGTLLIINDRADIARLLGAGLHVGQDDLPPAEARRIIGPETVLGYSTHNESQLTAAANEPINYVALGPMFATQSKLNPDPVVGLQRLAEWRRLTAYPLVAIGGITRDTARHVLEAGADSVAVIADCLPAVCSAAAIRERIEDWLARLRD